MLSTSAFQWATTKFGGVWETPPGTDGVLTEVELGALGRFAAFDDLVTLTVRAADGDERHGPFLPDGGYEDKAQCASHRSPSPLLKHYLVFHLRQPSKVSVVEEKAPCGTHGVLAQVPLGAAACFPAFDDLLTLTRWTPNGDERHEPLLAAGRCQD